MRRRPTPPPMSLFPFLDTLVCTMGALILMLLAMTPKIKERAQARLQAQMEAQAPAAAEDPVSDTEPAPQAEPQPVTQPEPEPVVEKFAMNAAADKARIEEEHAAERKRRRAAWFKTATEAREKLAARQAEYRQRRQSIKDADQRLKDLQDQVLKSQLKAESVDKADESLSAAADRLEAQQERVAQEIAKTRKNIDVLNRRQAVAKNEYSLVPYDGTSGTVRRPIYIECTGNGFRFLPEDESVSRADLESFPENYNPLLTGAQALVRFWARRRRNSPQSEPEPYVLLLVRPSGCVNYYIARQCLSSLNVNFGYELIEEDWKLSIPDADPIAKSLLKETLETTVQSGRPARNAFAEAGRDGFDSDFSRGDRPNGIGPSRGDDKWGNPGSGNGRGNATGSGQGTGRKPGVKFGPATRADRNAAGGAAGDDPLADAGGDSGTTKGTVTGAGATTAAGAGSSGTEYGGRGTRGTKAAGMSGAGRSGAATGRGTGAGNGLGDSESDENSELTLADSPTGAGTGTGKGSASSNGNGGSSDTGSLFGGTGQNARPGRDGLGRDGSGSNGSGRNGTGRGGSARPATLGGNSPDPGDGDGSGDGSDPPDPSLPTLAVSRSRSGTGTGSVNALGASPETDGVEIGESGTGLAADRLSGANGGPGSANGSTSRGSRSGSPTSGSPTSGSPGSGSPGSGSPMSRPSNSSMGNSSAADDLGSNGSSSGSSSSGNASGGGSPSSVQFGGPGASVSLGGKKKSKLTPKDDDPDDGPRISEDNGKTGGPLGRSRGPRKWGKAGNKATTGYERRIEVRLASDRILVGSKDVAVPVRRDDSADDIVHRVVNAIDFVADKWGEPPDGFYWVPAVRFVVYPGGDAYSEKLSKVLEQRYSVNSTIEFAEDKSAKKAAPRGKP